MLSVPHRARAPRPEAPHYVLGGDGSVQGAPINDSALPATMAPNETMARVDSYKSIRVLGRGVSGEVILAQEEQGKLYALKHIRVPRHGRLSASVIREPQLLKDTQGHPNIVKFLHCVYSERTTADSHKGMDFFIVLEYAKHDLESLISAVRGAMRQIPASTIRVFARQLFEGLAFLHKKGFLHRDIKPQNLLVRSTGELVITDFGLAGHREKDQSLSIQSGCYRHYSIFIELRPYDDEVDVWSAGAVVYEMCTGTPLLEFPSLYDLYRIYGVLTPEEWHDSLNAALWAKGRPAPQQATLAWYLGNIVDCNLRDLIADCQRLHPRCPTAQKLLKHPGLQVAPRDVEAHTQWFSQIETVKDTKKEINKTRAITKGHPPWGAI
jgi:serine/threonine protein kinase